MPREPRLTASEPGINRWSRSRGPNIWRKNPDIEAHPLPPADRRQARVQAGTRQGGAGTQRVREQRLEIGGDRIVGIHDGSIDREILALATARQGDLFHLRPVDQLGRLLAGTDQLPQHHGSDADREAPGHGAAGASSR